MIRGLPWAALSVLLVVALHEADASTELASDRLLAVGLADTDIQELGASSGDGVSAAEMTQEANAEDAKAKAQEKVEAKKVEDSGMTPEAVAEMDAHHAKMKEEQAEQAMQKAESESDEMPSTDDILDGMNSKEDSETEDEVGDIVPGDIKAIKAAMRYGIQKSGMEETMSKAAKDKLLSYEANRAELQAIAEVGLPPHIMDAILKDPTAARKMYGKLADQMPIAGGFDYSAEDPSSKTLTTEEKLKQQLQIRRDETLEQYFIRLLKFKAGKFHLTFKDAKSAHDWYVGTSGTLVKGEKGLGWESSIRKAAYMVAQARVEQVMARVENARTHLTKARTDLAKEINKKAVAGKMAAQYNAIKQAADKKASEAQKDKRKLHEWSKKSSQLASHVEELNAEEKHADKDMGREMELAGESEKEEAKMQKRQNSSEKTQKAAAVRVDKAKAAMLEASSEEQIDAAKAELQSAESVAASFVKKDADNANRIKQATSEQKTASSSVLLDQTKVAALKNEEAKNKDELEKANEFKRMYKTKAGTAKNLKSTGGKKAEELEQAFVQAVLNAVRQPRMIKVKSATYICPNQLNPKTQEKIPDENIIAEMEGNQNGNMRQACDGYTNCDYMVDPAVIGEAAKDCVDYAYTVKYTCTVGLPKKFGVRQVVPGEKVEPESKVSEAPAMVLLQVEPDDVQEAEDESGETAAQKDTEKLNEDMNNLKESIEEEDPTKKKDDTGAPLTENTEDAVKEAEAELNGIGMGAKKQGRLREKEMTAALDAGPGRRSLKLLCSQPQDPVITEKEQVVKAAKAAVEDAVKRLQDDADEEEEKSDETVAKEKAEAARAKEEAHLDSVDIAQDEQDIKHLESEIETLNSEISSETDQNTKEELQQQLEGVASELAGLKTKVETAKKKRDDAVAGGRVASERMHEEQQRFEDTTKTEMHSPPDFESAQMDVTALRRKLKETLGMIEHVMAILADETQSDIIFSDIQQLDNLMKEKHEYEKKYEDSKRHRDEITLDVSDRSQKEHKGTVVADQKAEVAAQADVDSFKLELAKDISESDRSQLEAKLAEAEKKLAGAKKQSMSDEFMPAIKETTVVTKLEKAGLVKERKRTLQRTEEDMQLTDEELHFALASLKDSHDPDEIFKLISEVGTLKRRVMREQNSVNRKQTNLVDAEHIDAQPGTAFLDELEGSVTNAKTEVAKEEDQIAHLQSEIDMSDDPMQVKKYVAEMDVAKQKISTSKEAVNRRQARVDKAEKVVDMETDEEEHPPEDKMALMEAASPQLSDEQAQVDKLNDNLQAANADFAGAINHVLRHKELKMKRAVGKAQKHVSRYERQLERAKDNFKKTKKVMEFEGKAAHMFQRIQDSILNGNYEQAKNLQKIHKKTKKISKRTDGQVAQDRIALSSSDPKTGMCVKGECCLRAYKDPICADETAKVCQDVSAPDMEDWKELTPFSGLVQRGGNEGQPVQTLNTTMHLKAVWARSVNGRVGLEAQVCGKFTKEGSDGASVCFPQEADGSAKGIPMGVLIDASPGRCVRTSDFVSVMKEKLGEEVAKGMDLREKLEKAKPGGASGKPRQIDSITEAVSRAIGGAFKGSMGGVSKDENNRELQRSTLEMIQYAVNQDWEDLLSIDGSFMITQGPGGDAAGSASGSAAGRKF